MRRMAMVFLLGIAAMASTAQKAEPRPGWFGLGYNVHIQPARQWLHVVKLAPGGPAEKAGLHVLDVIVEANGAPFRFADDRAALAYFKKFKPGERVVLTMLRKGVKQRVTLTAVPMPDQYYAVWLKNESLAKANQRPQ